MVKTHLPPNPPAAWEHPELKQAQHASSESASSESASSESASSEALARLVERAQGGDVLAVEALLEQFQPLLRSRMRHLWAAISTSLRAVEWADVEAQVHLLFLTRLRAFEARQGVYFPHYITRFLDFDCRAWLRHQQQEAIPFSQLEAGQGMEAGDEDDGVFEPESCDAASLDWAQRIEGRLGLREAISGLPQTQQHVLWQCCVAGRTEHEVASQLGVSRSTVRNRLAGALANLRAVFDDDANDDANDDATRNRTVSKSRTGRGQAPAKASRKLLSRGWNWMSNDMKRPDLVGIGAGRTVLLQGVFEFEATGIKTPVLLSPRLTYTVPAGCVLGVRFFRVGVVCDALVCFSTVVNGLTHRLVPVAANATIHVPLAIVDPIVAGSQIEIHVASDAPGTAIVDIGCLQMPA
jgi:RNA polymerase sigma factor (sigma-70 family)